MKKIYYGLGVILILIVGICYYANQEKLGASVLSLQTDNSKSVTSTDIGNKTALDVNVAGGAGSVLVNPTDGAVATTTAGSMLGTTTLYFKITSLDYAGGETAPSSELSCSLGEAVAGAPDGCIVTFTPNALAASARVWVGTSTGVYNFYTVGTSSTLIATTVGLTAGTIPTTNTAYEYATGNIKINDSYLKSFLTADGAVKTGAGFVHTVTFSPSDAAATAGTIAILDATTASALATTTVYYVPAAAIAPVTITLDQNFTNGIYVDFTTTDDVNVSVSYR